jgi:glucose/arabinose dehydrogenase
METLRINKRALLAGVSFVSCMLFLQACDSVGDEDGDDIILEMVADGFTHPLLLIEPPDGSGRLFVVDQIGTIEIIDANGTVEQEPFLDIRDQIVDLDPEYDERGLLGLAFHPDYEDNGRFYVYYTAPLDAGAPAGFDHTNRVSEFTVMGTDANSADPNSERILLSVHQPQANHSAGMIAFGPDDGYLYVALGDGGGANDTSTGHVADWYDENGGGNGQDITQNLLGSILRIDVDGAEPYDIPADNPFVDVDGALDEIYAYGFRNPYRFSFDMGGSNDLLVGDAGQDLWEEVSLVTSGGNYGWNVKEGAHCFDAENPETVPADCPDVVGQGHPDAGAPLIDPVIEFANANQAGGRGLVVVGGYVYRGDDLPELSGLYFFGVASRGENLGGEVFIAEPSGASDWDFASFTGDGRLNDFLLSFGQDLDGEVYVLTAENLGPTGNTGTVFRIASE